MFVLKMWSWICLTIALILCLTLNDTSEAKQAMLVGTVYCDPCFSQIFSESSHFISGALVAVECGDGIQTSSAEPGFREEVKTDEKGEFKVKLPFLVSKHVNKIDGCIVKLISSSEPDCAVAATATSSSIQIKAKTPGKHVFTAGSFTFRPLEQQKQCQIKARNWDSIEVSASPPLPSPSPAVDGIPILPVTHGKETTMELDNLVNADASGLPYPNPSDPFQPPLIDLSYQPPPPSMFTQNLQPPPPSTFNPIPSQPPPDSIFNSIQYQPPPDSIFGSLPFQPSPPSFFPQILTPPPPSFFPSLQVPPLPDFIESPPLPSSMPPPAVLPSFPPFPFQPSSGLPGMRPATSSAHLIKASSP